MYHSQHLILPWYRCISNTTFSTCRVYGPRKDRVALPKRPVWASPLRLVRKRNVENRTAPELEQIDKIHIFCLANREKQNPPTHVLDSGCVEISRFKTHQHHLSFPSPSFSFSLRQKTCSASIHLVIHVDPSRIAPTSQGPCLLTTDKEGIRTPPSNLFYPFDTTATKLPLSWSQFTNVPTSPESLIACNIKCSKIALPPKNLHFNQNVSGGFHGCNRECLGREARPLQWRFRVLHKC